MSSRTATAPDLREPDLQAAERIIPGDLVRRDNAVWRIIRIAVSTDAVEAEAERLGGAAAFGSFSFLPGELVRVTCAGSLARAGNFV